VARRADEGSSWRWFGDSGGPGDTPDGPGAHEPTVPLREPPPAWQPTPTRGDVPPQAAPSDATPTHAAPTGDRPLMGQPPASVPSSPGSGGESVPFAPFGQPAPYPPITPPVDSSPSGVWRPDADSAPQETRAESSQPEWSQAELAQAESSQSESAPSGVPEPHPAPNPADAETAMIPRVAYYETAILPKVVDKPEAPPTLLDLAIRYGLKPAGTRPSVREYLGQLWSYREFIAAYANGRAIAQYGNTRLGRLWQVLGPLMNAGVYFLVFGVILDLRRGMDNFVGYLTVGIFIFAYTQQVVQQSAASISGQLGLVRAIQFPRASLPIASVLMQLQTSLIAMVVLGVVVLGTREPMRPDWIWLLPALALQTVFNTGLALGVARLGAEFPDIRQVIPHVMRIWFYASGVFYSVDFILANLPEAVGNVVRANPMLIYIELARYSLLENPPLASTFTELWIMGFLWALVAALFGFLYFWRGEPEYGRG
jgi:ABC-type polysaccharide/polyol phosphate export systems, permease component